MMFFLTMFLPRAFIADVRKERESVGAVYKRPPTTMVDRPIWNMGLREPIRVKPL